MSVHRAEIAWERAGSRFTDNRYSREHRWRFDGGAVVTASSSPDVVRVPFSNPAGVDPEEALVAAVSSCHMLWFLSLAAKAGFVVDQYLDRAEGAMADDERGKPFMSRVTLRPRIVFSGTRVPDDAAVDELHHAAHAECFIANSIRGDVRVEGAWRLAE